MELNKALGIFGLTSINASSGTELKKLYRQLTKKYHPDLHPGEDTNSKMCEINEAHSIIEKAISELSIIENGKINSRKCIITINNLQNIYSGHKIDFEDNGEKVSLTNGNIRLHDVYIAFNVKITNNNSSKEWLKILRHNKDDVYNIYCTLDVQSHNDIEHITVELLNKKLNIDMEQQSLVLKLRFEYNIVVNIRIDKKIYVNSK